MIEVYFPLIYCRISLYISILKASTINQSARDIRWTILCSSMVGSGINFEIQKRISLFFCHTTPENGITQISSHSLFDIPSRDLGLAASIYQTARRRISGCCLHLDNVWDKLYVFLQWIKASSRSSKTNLQRHLNKHLFISLSSLIEFGDFPPDINYCWSQKNDFPTIPFESKFFKAFWKQVIKHISKPLNQVHSLHLRSSSS